MSGIRPFDDLTDKDVQYRFSNGVFPNDAASLPKSFILSGWSEEFSQELAKQGIQHLLWRSMYGLFRTVGRKDVIMF